MATRSLSPVVFLFILVAVWALPRSCTAQTTPDCPTCKAVVENLTEQGFENVSAALAGGRLVVRFENRVYRYDIRAVREALPLLAPAFDEAEDVVLIPLRRRIPLATVTFSTERLRAWQDGTIPEAELFASAEIDSEIPRINARYTRPANSSSFRFDLVAVPMLTYELGNFSRPVEMQIELAPTLSATLWPGARLNAQLIVPLYENFLLRDSEVRPGLITLDQVVRLPYNVFFSLAAGRFSDDRYGLHSEAVTHMQNGRLWLMGQIGYTGHLSFRNNTWRYGDPDAVTYLVGARYQVLPRYDLSLEADFGRFLYGDYGWRLAASRSFGEFEVTFFGIFTNLGENAGVAVVLPLPTSRHLKPSVVRPRPARTFTFTYYYDKLTRAGELYDTGSTFHDFWYGLEPAQIKNRLLRLSTP